MSTGGKVVWPRANAWGTSPSVNIPCSLTSVMDEEYARQLQKEEEKVADVTQHDFSPVMDLPTGVSLESEVDTSSDLLLAQMLQLKFDKEHDAELAREEHKFNGDSKVSISFSNYRSVHPAYDDDDDDDEDDFYEEWIVGDEGDRTPEEATSPCQTGGEKKTIITKHDALVCGRKNASRVMDQFPPDFPSGNSIGMDMKLSNSVYNVLKEHSHREEGKAQRLHEKKEHSTAEMAVDPKTRIMLYKLVNSGLLESITGTISTGKEAVVIHATGGQVEDQLIPKECALKVFKTTLNEFKNRDSYIKDDYRFRARWKKHNPRKFIRMWAEKEMHNLNRMREAGIRCPEVVLLKKHILVMSFIGKDQRAAPKLKHVKLSTSEMQCVYEECVTMMETMYRKSNLIHADLSEYNMLWHEGQLWFIDVSQSVEPTHSQGLKFLLRDCTNVSNFFRKQGVHDVLKPHDLFNRVTGLSLEFGNEKEFLNQIEVLQQSKKFQPSSPKERNFAFDYFFDKVQRGSDDEEEEEDLRKSPNRSQDACSSNKK